MAGDRAGRVIRAVVLDVDGTVLRGDHTVGPVTRDAVADVVALGVPVILASSRSPLGLQPVQGALGLDGQYLVAFQGALTGRLTGATFQTLDELQMDLESAGSIASMASAEGYSIGWYAGLAWYVDKVDDRVRREALITGETPREADLARLTSRPHKILCIGPDGSSPKQLERLAARLPAGTVGRRSHSSYLEVTAAAADKPFGVAVLGQTLGFGPEHVVTFGDGDNDLGMFGYAGIAVAMGNASPAILAASTMTTTSNEQDGVAVALRRLIDDGLISGARMPN